MSRLVAPIIVPLALSILIVTCDSSADESAMKGVMSFGSQAILESCFTTKDLQGSPEDIRHTPMSDAEQPAPIIDPIDAISTTSVGGPFLSIRRIEPKEDAKIIALTFDLCEGAHERSGYDSAVVNYLRQHRIKATFFAGGKWMRSHPDKAKQLIADPLFEIGNHSWSHANIRMAREQTVLNQVQWTQAEYRHLRKELADSPCALDAGSAESAKIPEHPRLFRFPYGSCSPESLKAVANLGLIAVQWDVVTGDPAKGRTASGIAATVLRATRPGSIVVAHANGRGQATAAALAVFIPRLCEQGYEFLTVSELLERGAAVGTTQCYERKPGDTRGYDRKFGKDE